MYAWAGSANAEGAGLVVQAVVLGSSQMVLREVKIGN